MFTRKSASIVIGAVAVTALAIVVARIAESRMRSAEEWERIYANLPPKDAPPPPNTVPPVEEQPVVDQLAGNPFAGRVFGKLVPTEEHAKKMKEMKRTEESFENIRDGAYLVAVVIPGLALFLLWCGWVTRGETATAPTMVAQGGISHEPDSHQPGGIPDGDEVVEQEPESPPAAEALESLSALLRDLQEEA